MKKQEYIRPSVEVINVGTHGLLDQVGSGTVDPIDILGKENDFDFDDDFDDEWLSNPRWRNDEDDE